MAQHNKRNPAKRPIGKAVPPRINNQGKEIKLSLYESLNNWLNRKEKGITILAFSLCTLFSLLLFQARMDIGGDDSGYILRAYDFIHKGAFPSYQGPLYPLVLSIFISLFGIRIVLLKVVSLLFNFFALYFLFKTFRKRLPALVFFPVLILTSINAYILSFASLTYSEACFMFLQALVFYFFFKLIDKLNQAPSGSIKDTYPYFLYSALFVFLLSLSRSVGLFALPGLLLYFIVRRQFRSAAYFTGAFALFYILFGFIKKFIFHVSAEWGAERSALMLKDQYNPSKGVETMSGFGERFIGNTNLYLSKRFFQVIGLRSPDAIDINKALTFFFVGLSVFALYRAIKSKNNYILASALYCGVMLCCTFLAVQTQIDQPRLVMVYVPFLLFIFIYAIYDALKKAPWAGQSMLVYLIVISFIASGASLINRTAANMPVINHNLHGDMSYGFTPDWANYIKMSEWCADNLPANSMVAARKAEISFMYTDKEIFFPVFRAYSTDPDSVLAYLNKNHVNYVLLASLRINPNVADGNIINTLWRMMGPVEQKYPQKLKLVHQEGTAEPAFLYMIAP